MPGPIQTTPGPAQSGLLTWAKIRAMVTGALSTIVDGSITDLMMQTVSFAKLITGTLTGTKTLIFSGATVIAKSADYVKDTQHFYDGTVAAPGGGPVLGTLTSATAAFTLADVGLAITSPVFPVGTIISAYTSATAIELSTHPTLVNATNVAFIIPGRPMGTGWALYGDGHAEINNPADGTVARSVLRGNLETLGLRTLPDGSLEMGTGAIRLRVNDVGDFLFGYGTTGAVVGITHDGTLFIGGSTLANAVASFDSAGNFILKNTAQSVHAISIGALDFSVRAPAARPPGGAFDTALSVALFCQTQNATMYYTIDGTTPDTSKTLYTGTPIALAVTTTIKARAYVGGLFASSVSTFTFTNDAAIVPNPQFNPVGGTYTPVANYGVAALQVDLRCSLVGSSIRYTIDGTTPSDTTGTLISPATALVVPFGTVSVIGTKRLNAIAFKAAKTNSGVVTEVYNVTPGGVGGGGGGRGNVP